MFQLFNSSPMGRGNQPDDASCHARERGQPVSARDGAADLRYTFTRHGRKPVVVVDEALHDGQVPASYRDDRVWC